LGRRVLPVRAGNDLSAVFRCQLENRNASAVAIPIASTTPKASIFFRRASARCDATGLRSECIAISLYFVSTRADRFTVSARDASK